VDLVSFVSNIDQRLSNNALKNLLSRSKITDYEIPNCTQTLSKKIIAVASAVILFLQATMMSILENMSMTTKTQSLSCLVEGRPDM